MVIQLFQKNVRPWIRIRIRISYSDPKHCYLSHVYEWYPLPGLYGLGVKGWELGHTQDIQLTTPSHNTSLYSIQHSQDIQLTTPSQKYITISSRTKIFLKTGVAKPKLFNFFLILAPAPASFLTQYCHFKMYYNSSNIRNMCQWW